MAILDLIEYPDTRADEIVHRIPEYGSGEFRLGSQCVVRESQRAVFARDGKSLDVLGPGRHTLSTANIPLLSELLGIPFGGDSPFRAEVYFVNMREFTDMKWGTVQPVLYRDQEFGMVRLRAFGTYSMRVKDPQLFTVQVVGARSTYSTADIDDYLRSIILNEFNDMLGHTLTSLLDVQAMTQDMAQAAQHALTPSFDRLGLDLLSFQIVAITPPEEVQKRIDERSGIGVLGNMNTYMQYQAAQAMGNIGEGGGGEGGGNLAEGAGLGAGLGMGMAMSDMMRQAMTGGQQQQQPTQQQAPQQPESPAGGGSADPAQRLAQAKQMLDQGLISEEEYNEIRQRILASMWRVAVLQWFQRVKIVQVRQPSRAVRSSFSRAPQPTVGEIGSITDFRNMSDPNAPVVVEKSAAGGQLLWSADFHPDELEPVDDE